MRRARCHPGQAPGAALGEWPVGRSGETDPVSPEGSREVKANVGPASSKVAASRFPSPKEIFRAPLKRRCPDLRMHALTTGVHLARAVPTSGLSPGSAVHAFGLESSGNRWGQGQGVKPNKPKATDYQQPLTTQEARGGSSPTNTTGKLSDSQRKKV